MTNPVNYIRQLSAAHELFEEDERLTPWHISLYYALFQSWNASKFRNPISINRSEMMSASKIGSVNTYSKCLRQLTEFGYIRYTPSKSAQRGSKVHMFIFDTTGGSTTDTRYEQEPIQQMRPSTNNTNKKKQIKPIKQRNKSTAFSPPSIDEVKVFFLELKSTTDQAEQFHNHFESNGWLVGGKAKMKDWKAAVRNWIKRSANFSKTSSNQDRLNTNQDKDYSMPL